MKDIYLLRGDKVIHADETISPGTRDDIERQKIFLQFDELIDILIQDINSRRCVATFMTEKDGQLSYSCPSLIQLFTEKGKLNIKTYFRSANFTSNFNYDKNTLRMLMTRMLFKLPKIKMGYIKIFIGCPHEA